MRRRDLLIASGVSLLAGARATGQDGAPHRAQTQTRGPERPSSKRSRETGFPSR